MKPAIDPLTGGLAWVDQRQLAKDRKEKPTKSETSVDINKDYRPRPSKYPISRITRLPLSERLRLIQLVGEEIIDQEGLQRVL
jgi:hypothetical protein